MILVSTKALTKKIRDLIYDTRGADSYLEAVMSSLGVDTHTWKRSWGADSYLEAVMSSLGVDTHTLKRSCLHLVLILIPGSGHVFTWC